MGKDGLHWRPSSFSGPYDNCNPYRGIVGREDGSATTHAEYWRILLRRPHNVGTAVKHDLLPNSANCIRPRLCAWTSVCRRDRFIWLLSMIPCMRKEIKKYHCSRCHTESNLCLTRKI